MNSFYLIELRLTVNRFGAEIDILPIYNTNTVYASNQVLIE